MMVDKNENVKETAITLMELSEDDKIRLQCEARERYDRDMSSFKNRCLREGREKGRQEGIQEGIQQGEEDFATLTKSLLDSSRFEDLRKATTDIAFRQQLYAEYNVRLDKI